MKREWICEDCVKYPDSPMIEENLWFSIANKKTLLCLECFEKRIGRQIVRKDFADCLFTKILLKLIKRADEGQL